MQHGKLLEELDIGDSVRCDLCNTEFRGRPETGGMLGLSKGICPLCTPKFEADLVKYEETEHIRARCPPGMTFHAWIMELRGGNNTIRTYELIPE